MMKLLMPGLIIFVLYKMAFKHSKYPPDIKLTGKEQTLLKVIKKRANNVTTENKYT